MSNNQWGDGDVFSRYVDPGRDEQRVRYEDEKSTFDKLIHLMWKIIVFGATLVLSLMIIAIVAGAIIGFAQGIYNAL